MHLAIQRGAARRPGWIIRLKTSGTLTFTDRNRKIDVFLVGGGGGGRWGWYDSTTSSGGGGGGYTRTVKDISVQRNTGYAVVIGDGGESDENGNPSSAFGHSASGGYTGTNREYGGNGGSGGAGASEAYTPGYPGGSDGGDGAAIGAYGTHNGIGQGTTTREFGMSGWTLYAGGGGGGAGTGSDCVGAGGAGGGGAGGQDGSYDLSRGQDGKANTGGGGGGAGGQQWCENGAPTAPGGKGGSGIVCIRNSQSDVLPVVFNGTWIAQLIFNGTDVKSLIYDGVRLFFRAMRRKERDGIDARKKGPVCGPG